MKKVKIGIIGGNYMGKMHADCYRLLDGVEVVAVADINQEVAESLANSFGAKAFTDGKEMIKSCELDAVDICLPTFLHTEYALFAMDYVPYIFIEKPVALNMSECALLMEKQKQTGAEIQVGHVIRFWDEYAYLKKLIEENTYGKVVNASFKRLSPSPSWSKNNWLRNAKLSGGAVLDLHIHDIDFMLYLFGKPEKYSFVKNTLGESNSYIITICNYGDFAVSVEDTWFLPSSYPFNMYYRVVFENAVVEFDRNVVTVFGSENKFNPEIKKNEIGSKEGFNGGNISDLGGYYNELEYFTNAIANGKSIEKATLKEASESLEFVISEV